GWAVASGVEVDAVDYGLAEFFDQGCSRLAVHFDGKTGAIGGADGGPKARPGLVPELPVQGVTLVLGNPDTGTGVEEIGSILAKEQSAGDGKVRGGDHVGVVEPSRPRSPLRQGELAFRAVDMGGTEGDGKAYAGIQQNIVVGKIAGIAAEDVGGEVRLAEKFFGRAQFIVIAARRQDGELGNFLVESAGFG